MSKFIEFLKRYQFFDFAIEYKYILLTNNCQKLDPEIFLETANFCDFNIHVDSSVKTAKPHIYVWFKNWFIK